MEHLPVFLDIRGRDVLVVGGGTVAARKAEILLRAQARVAVVAPEAGPAVAGLVGAGEVRHFVRPFEAGDLADRALVVAATDDAGVNRAVYEAAMRAGLPVNVVDCPAQSSFIFPAIVDRSPLVIAVSSGGTSPVLARLLRAKIESLIPHGYGRLAALAGRFREAVRERIADPVARRRFWEDALTGPVAEATLGGNDAKAASCLGSMLARRSADARPTGEVYLVGAGPGDPDLLTFRALRLMQQADVVLHDRLVPSEIVDLARRDAERIDVGKRRGHHAMRQDEIGALMVRLARGGNRVLRLKGGDPFLFGRGGEETELLAAHGIPFQVVPGVTAAAGCAAIAGIPLTHRDIASSCVFVSGHVRTDGHELDWTALARPQQTVVVYMGLHTAHAVACELISHGAPGDRPAAVVINGTRADQRVVISTIARLAAGQPVASEVADVGLLIIGDVVRLAELSSENGVPDDGHRSRIEATAA